MKKGLTTRKIKPKKKRAMNAKKTFSRKKMKGGGFSQQLVLKIVNCAVVNILKPETCYDRIDSTKYKYKKYDDMIIKLNNFVIANDNFKGTILDELLKKTFPRALPDPPSEANLQSGMFSKFKNKLNTTFSSKPIECTKDTFPKILDMICSLKIKSSNIAYYFDKNFDDKWEKTALDSFIPENIKEYFRDEEEKFYTDGDEPSINIISKPLKEIILNDIMSGKDPHIHLEGANDLNKKIIEFHLLFFITFY